MMEAIEFSLRWYIQHALFHCGLFKCYKLYVLSFYCNQDGVPFRLDFLLQMSSGRLITLPDMAVFEHFQCKNYFS